MTVIKANVEERDGGKVTTRDGIYKPTHHPNTPTPTPTGALWKRPKRGRRGHKSGTTRRWWEALETGHKQPRARGRGEREGRERAGGVGGSKRKKAWDLSLVRWKKHDERHNAHPHQGRGRGEREGDRPRSRRRRRRRPHPQPTRHDRRAPRAAPAPSLFSSSLPPPSSSLSTAVLSSRNTTHGPPKAHVGSVPSLLIPQGRGCCVFFAPPVLVQRVRRLKTPHLLCFLSFFRALLLLSPRCD